MPILKQLKQHTLLLDTHVLLWAVEGNRELRPVFRRALDAAAERDDLKISPLTVWEIGMLVEKKRISLERDVLDWVDHLLEMRGIEVVTITPRIAIQSSRLPGEVHGDPVDRILIATAHDYGAILVTADKQILEYGKNHFVSVYNPMK